MSILPFDWQSAMYGSNWPCSSLHKEKTCDFSSCYWVNPQYLWDQNVKVHRENEKQSKPLEVWLRLWFPGTWYVSNCCWFRLSNLQDPDEATLWVITGQDYFSSWVSPLVKCIHGLCLILDEHAIFTQDYHEELSGEIHGMEFPLIELKSYLLKV